MVIGGSGIGRLMVWRLLAKGDGNASCLPGGPNGQADSKPSSPLIQHGGLHDLTIRPDQAAPR